MKGLSTSKEKTPMMPQTEMQISTGNGLYFLPNPDPGGGSAGGGKRPGDKPVKKKTAKKPAAGKAKPGAKRR
jgi:hypothetical protein